MFPSVILLLLLLLFLLMPTPNCGQSSIKLSERAYVIATDTARVTLIPFSGLSTIDQCR